MTAQERKIYESIQESIDMDIAHGLFTKKEANKALWLLLGKELEVVSSEDLRKVI